MVLVQKWRFFQLFFLGNIGQENVFYDILERKKTFLKIQTQRASDILRTDAVTNQPKT